MKLELHIHFDNPLHLILEAGSPAVLASINTKLDSIMSLIKEFAAKMAVHNDKIDTAVQGLKADVDALEAKIKELQESPGEDTPENKAILDDIESKASALADNLAAFDEIRPPVAPTEG